MTRRTRERIVGPDGVERPQDPPRVDVLHYPATGWTTLLVRRTHDVNRAEALAMLAWADLQDAGHVPADVFLGDGHRVGWWTTGHRRRDMPDVAHAYDAQDRAVVWAYPEQLRHVWAPGPGVEFLPDRKVAPPPVEPAGPAGASNSSTPTATGRTP